jgi:hypothetical protein
MGVCRGETTCEDLGLVTCGTSCANTANDPAHCGGCDSACGTDEACADGAWRRRLRGLRLGSLHGRRRRGLR